MKRCYAPLLLILLLFLAFVPGRLIAAAATNDPLNRTNPRAAVTAFLQACHSDDYSRAAEYLDLGRISEARRAEEGPQLARQLEAILNADGHFNVLQLSQSAQGNLSDDTNPSLDHVASISRKGKTFEVELEQEEVTPGLPVWLFSPATVSRIPLFTPTITESAFEARLPGFLVSAQMLETPLWKWVALVVVAGIVILLLRLAGQLILLGMGRLGSGPGQRLSKWAWVHSVLQPWMVFLAALAFGMTEQFINPSALSRLYIGRAILLVIVSAFGWCLINLVDLFLVRIESMLEPRQRTVSHSMIYMGKRTAKIAIVIIAAIIVLDNWGYNMTTMIAGLGVGGIAIALAAQSTIANVFGGVSVISDHPVMVGDFGNFGGVLGTVEDIGMRSTRVRTLNRTMMSIPNSSFAGMNLENYALRDKILFNPTLQIKRGTPKEKLRQLMEALEQMLHKDQRMEALNTPIRLSALTAPSYALEIFAYALTADINEFYKVEADLFLEIDEILAASGVELV